MSSRLSTRIVPRATRVARTTKPNSRRFQSTTSSTTQAAANAAPNGTMHFLSGVAGGIVGACLVYGIYTLTPSGKMMKAMNTTIKETNKKYEQLAATLKNKTPSTDEALGKVKDVCYSYAVWVPGGRQYVDVVFKDIDDIREANQDEVDKLVAEAYKEFQNITAAGLSLDAASRSWEALQRLSQRIATLSANASDQLLDNHPQLKEKFGGSFETLKQLGSQYGPEAKKVADDTWKEVNIIIKGGFTAENADKVRKLVEEKTQQVRKMGDQVWDKGLEKAKPYLDKSPAVRDLINNNKDVLKQGNASELFSKIQSLTESGDSKKLEDYVKQAVDKAKQSGNKGQSWASSLVGGGTGFGVLGQFFDSSSEGVTEKVKDNIGVLSEVYKKHSDEGQKLLEETKEDLRKLLEEKAKKAQKIAEAASKGK